MAVLKKFSDDQAGSQAALMAYWGFFSLFPLLLLFVTVLGFVLQNNAGAKHAVVNSALQEFPIIGSSIQTHSLNGSGLALVIGVVGALVSGLGITNAAQNAFNTVYAVPHRERPNFISLRLRGLKLLVAFGVLQVISTVVSGVVSGGFGGSALTVAGIVLSLAINVVLFFAVFRLLTDNLISTRELVPGIVIAAVGWELLQAVGGIYIGHVGEGRQPDLRHVRHRHRPAGVVVPGCADRRLFRRDQHGAYAGALAEKHSRSPDPGGSSCEGCTGEDRGARRKAERRGRLSSWPRQES